AHLRAPLERELQASGASLVDSRRGGNGCFDRGPYVDERSLRPHLRVTKEHLAPRGRLAPALEHAAIDERPAVEVVVHVAREDEPVHERRMKEKLLEPFQRPGPDQVAAADAHEILADVKVPVLVRGVDVADDFDLARIAGAEAVLVRETDVVERQRIEA